MNNKRLKKPRPSRRALCAVSGATLCLAAVPAWAQDVGRPLTGNVAADPNPYYIGVSEGLVHDSNVYRIPSGTGDNYSSTSVFGGFDQPISRQRIFGRGAVSLNRYQDQTQLNNTSYDLSAGANLETIENISGNLNVAFNRNLAAPAASVGVPTAIQNIATTERIDSRLRWGGPSLLTVEGSLGYSRLDYSAPEFVSSESREGTGSLGLFYRPGAYLRVGVAGRYERTRTPKAVLDPVTGTYQSNTTNGRNLDLLADYNASAAISTNARLSYTRQTNSSITGADFSGLTGSLAVNWRVTGKTALQFDASRDAGFDTASTTRYAAVQVGTGVVLTPVSALYENNRVTNSVGLGATYDATAKISANAHLRYTRARLASAIAAGTANDSTDVLKAAALGVNYAITRAWGASCTIAYEMRDVSGVVVYSYRANTVGCSTQFTWR